jgi:hypothetical protein
MTGDSLGVAAAAVLAVAVLWRLVPARRRVPLRGPGALEVATVRGGLRTAAMTELWLLAARGALPLPDDERRRLMARLDDAEARAVRAGLRLPRWRLLPLCLALAAATGRAGPARRAARDRVLVRVRR